MTKTLSKNKLYTIFIFSFISFAIYGMYVDFISYVETTNYILLVSVIIGAVIITPAFILDLKGVALKSYKPIKKTFGFLFLLVFSSSCSWAIIKYSLPVIYTQIYGSSHIDYDFVKEINNSAPSRYDICKPYIRLKRYDEIICVSKKLYFTVNIDNELKLSGKKTNLGFRVLEIEKHIN